MLITVFKIEQTKQINNLTWGQTEKKPHRKPTAQRKKIKNVLKYSPINGKYDFDGKVAQS